MLAAIESQTEIFRMPRACPVEVHVYSLTKLKHEQSDGQREPPRVKPVASYRVQPSSLLATSVILHGQARGIRLVNRSPPQPLCPTSASFYSRPRMNHD